MCGRPGLTQRHHIIPRSRGGDDSEGNRIDLCVWGNDCHGRAQRYEKGYLEADLRKAKEKSQTWAGRMEWLFTP